MALAGLTGRLARLEARLDDAAIRSMARQAVGEARTGGAALPVADCEAELRRFLRLVTVRVGPRPDARALAALIAEEYGASGAEVYADIKANRATRERGRTR